MATWPIPAPCFFDPMPKRPRSAPDTSPNCRSAGQSRDPWPIQDYQSRIELDNQLFFEKNHEDRNCGFCKLAPSGVPLDDDTKDVKSQFPFPVQETYRPEIDGLRAVAVMAVVCFHAHFTVFDTQLLSGGYLGVDVFFVISGY